MDVPGFAEIVEQNDQTAARREHLDKLQELVGNVYPNKFERSSLSGAEDSITALKAWKDIGEIEAEMAAIKSTLADGERPPAEEKERLNARLKALGNVRIAGRLTTPPRGNFVHLTDGIERLQIYCDKKGGFALVKNDGKETLDPENGWNAWKLIDHGDFVGVEGYLFITNTGEVSVHVEKLQFLAKAMVPMPDKMHGIEDPEIKQRQRYVDLIGSSLAVEHDGMTTREVFETRARTISSLRRYLEDHGYIEVETPMLTPKATGAAAKPFKTHHNALDIDLYARIAPELYLKRLVVGGFEKVYELNRNFRNEGISYKHNPEFTMLEFYCAYMDVDGMMDFCEELLNHAFMKAQSKSYEDDLSVTYEDKVINLNSFSRMTMREAVATFYPQEWLSGADIVLTPESLTDLGLLRRLAVYNEIEVNEFNKLGISGWSDEQIAEDERHARLQMERERPMYWDKTKLFEFANPTLAELERLDFPEPFWERYFTNLLGDLNDKEADMGALLAKLFEMYAERHLIQPTFIIDYPKSISPLSKANPGNPAVAERFELFINGMEVANGFSELNDPKEQYDRFIDQMGERERGDEEAMVLDEDYIRALSYGMPPAAGIGIGIDRLVMLLTNKHSIRDVILFPHMRPERKAPVEE